MDEIENRVKLFNEEADRLYEQLLIESKSVKAPSFWLMIEAATQIKGQKDLIAELLKALKEAKSCPTPNV